MAKSTKVNNSKKGSTQNPINMADKSAKVETVVSPGENWEEAYVEKLKEFDQMVNFKSLVGALDAFTRASTIVELISDETTSDTDDNIKQFVDKCDTVLDDDIYVAGQAVLTEALGKHCRVAKNKSDRVKSMAVIKAMLAVLEKETANVVIIRPVYETLVTYAGTLSNINADDAKIIAVSLLLNGIISKSIQIAERYGCDIINPADQKGEGTMAKNAEVETVDDTGVGGMTFKEVVAAPESAVAVVEESTAATADETENEVGGIVSSLSNEVYSRLAPAWKSVYAGREDELASSISKAVSLKIDDVKGSELKDSDKFIDNYIGEIGDSVNKIMADNKAAIEAGESPVLEGDNDALVGKVVMAGIFDCIAENRQDILTKLVSMLPEKYWENVASYVPEDIKTSVLKDVTVKETKEALSDMNNVVRAKVVKALASYSGGIIKSLGADGDGKEFSRHLGKTLATILTSKRGEGVRNTFKTIKDNAKDLFSRFTSIWDACDEKPRQDDSQEKVVSEVIITHDNKTAKAKTDNIDDIMDELYRRIGRDDKVGSRPRWK